MKNKAPMVRLGDYIEVCNTRNSDLEYGLDMIEGVNSKGEFCPPKAAVEGINLLPYKIVDPGDFVYNPSRLNIGSLALRKKPRCIVSHLYVVFHLTEWGKKNFLEDYLYLFFSRQTFRDLITYRNFGSQRPEFNFYQMCEVEVPKPSLDTQRELVAIYDGLKKIVAENEALIKPLEEACRAFVVDCQRKYPKEKLGKYIEEVSEKKSKGIFGGDRLYGVSCNGTFIPSIADQTKLELLIKLLRKKIVDYGRTNALAAKKYQEMLEATIKIYHERRKHLGGEEAGETQEKASGEILKNATEQALDILHKLNADRESFRAMGLTFEEKAFYDILIHVRDEHNFEYGTDSKFGNDKCKSLAKKIKGIIDTKSAFSDWLNNSRVKGALNQEIKLCLIKNGYPPRYSPAVFREIMGQVENFKENEDA